MEKRIIILCGIMALSVAGTGILLGAQHLSGHLVKGEPEYRHLVLNSSTEVEAKDEGYLHQADVKGNKIDMIGFSEADGAFGSIKKVTYDAYTFNGMVYNRSLINGFSSLTVTFSGGYLHYVFTDFLMEDMNFNSANVLASGEAVNVPEGKAYFLVYNESTTPVTIDSIDISCTCNGSVDASLLYKHDSLGDKGLGYARSMAKRTDLELGYVELENNPTKTTNNYSLGKHDGHSYNDSWYRFNGRYFSGSKDLGTDFTFGMTIIGNISQVLDEHKYFHYNVWPQFTYGNSADEPWTQCYIGNDQFEPLGAAHALHPDAGYSYCSYTGRFFGRYDYDEDQGIDGFADPDVATLEGDDTTTLRQAYETYSLPFWFVKFHVYLDDDPENLDVAVCDIFINGFKIEKVDVFYNYDTANKPSIRLKTLPMHLINYGINAEGDPADSYVGSFTYPRLVA